MVLKGGRLVVFKEVELWFKRKLSYGFEGSQVLS